MKDDREDLEAGIGLIRGLIGNRTGGDAKIEVHFNAGGIGVWVAATCCLVTLGVVLSGGLMAGLWISREFNRIDVSLSERKEENDRAQTYLSSIFGRVPELRKQIDKEVQQDKANAVRRPDHP